MKASKLIIWIVWLIATAVLLAYLGYRLLWSDDQSVFLLGEMTHGHHQLELACGVCHTSPFGGGEVLQQACVDCHGDALREAKDKHPAAKFTDPRNADRLANLDALQCVTCHREHKPLMTGGMGVTLPDDVCFLCHATIAESRPSHEGMAFDTCASAGCHNYHDNQALYEDFLLKHADQPALLSPARVMMQSVARFEASLAEQQPPANPAVQPDAPAEYLHDATVITEWAHSAHAQADVNCMECHAGDNQDWIVAPDHGTCESCHADEVQGFLSGMHGMRLQAGLSPMTPGMARLPMHPDAHSKELGCNSCHTAHDYQRPTAAVDACLGCHADEHSLAYRDSVHFDLWQKEVAGLLPAGSGVSCATCHMPRELHRSQGEEQVRVQHNQNANLRPVEKMVRTVCADCHGLGFTLDALADPELLRNNFQGSPSQHVPSIDMATARDQERSRR